MFMSCLVNYVYNMWHATGELRSSDGSDQGGQTSQRDNLVTTLPREINIITVSLFLSLLSSAICPRHQPPPLALKLHTLLKLRQPTPECRHPHSSCVKNINKIPTLLFWLDTLTPAPCLLCAEFINIYTIQPWPDRDTLPSHLLLLCILSPVILQDRIGKFKGIIIFCCC